MTEYDYSPEAYRRYMESQDRISRWVDNTEAHHHSFRVPYGPRSDFGQDDLDGMSEADEALPSGASAGGWYESKRRTGGRHTAAPAPPPLFYPQPHVPTPMYSAPMASAPAGYSYPYTAPQAYMSSPASPPRIIIQSIPNHRSHRHRSSRRSSSSSSKTKTYILPPPGSAGPPMMQISSSYGPPGVQPPPGTYSYPNSALPYTSGLPYPNHTYSPIGSPSMMGPPPPPPPYYPAQPQPNPAGTYVIMPKKGKHVRVTTHAALHVANQIRWAEPPFYIALSNINTTYPHFTVDNFFV
ncbi:hypothetical protein D9757_011190 [Collybiopsis confluens]|uniref:Uncharacterized protein n=1 Tax=Collybiopsis confluens TaxID=2823264 RepID=A0A8H5H379_9AGAR|nr:hypothetical protein D9757_011190 [Collybiopsis confluens]